VKSDLVLGFVMTMIDFNAGDNHGLSKFDMGIYQFISFPECLYVTISAPDAFWISLKVADLSMMLKVK
jgi:hypothetical protein